jgi:hypothetical protein
MLLMMAAPIVRKELAIINFGKLHRRVAELAEIAGTYTVLSLVPVALD